MNIKKQSFLKIVWSLLVGLLFLLPHIVRIATIGSFRDYSPFAAQSHSTTVTDETFMYAAQSGYMLAQHRLANDTDAFEHRDQPFPYSVLPAVIEIGLAKLTGSLDTAQIVSHFVFPAITTWILITLFAGVGAYIPLAALLSLSVLIIGFSPRTILTGNLSFLHHSRFIETLQAARSPHPNISFPHYLLAAMLAIAAVRRRSARLAITSGLLGGLLFFNYSFYAIAWSATALFLCLLSFWKRSGMPRLISLSLIATVVATIPFLLWQHASKASGAYLYRTNRLGMTYSHLPSKLGLELSISWLIVIGVAIACWLLFQARTRLPEERASSIRTTVLVFTCGALGGIAGMNMQLLTGFNVQAEFHFTHMVIQPVTLIVFAVLIAAWSARYTLQRTSVVSVGLFALLFLSCTASQIKAGIGSAAYHRISSSDRILFDWLRQNTQPGDVVATTDLRINTILPIFSHNNMLLVNGSRTSGSDQEMIERYLTAQALVGKPTLEVQRELEQRQSNAANLPLPWCTYSAYLFETSPFMEPGTRSIRASYLPGFLAQYQAIDLAQELQRFRVNYIWTEAGERPGTIVGWQTHPVLSTSDGTLWQLQPM